MNTVESIRTIDHQFKTGEKPVLVDCSDLKTRICKYSQFTGSSYKLVCELIGTELAKLWHLNAPECDLVVVKEKHIPDFISKSYFTKPCIGFLFFDTMIDITPYSFKSVIASDDNIKKLLLIALFDFWVANEDRNANNSNLMYDVMSKQIIPIDFGCIFNTAVFEYPLSQLTSTDTILYSQLFDCLTLERNKENILTIANGMKCTFLENIRICESKIDDIIRAIPTEWSVPESVILSKIQSLFDKDWVEGVWNNFIDCLKENLGYE